MMDHNLFGRGNKNQEIPYLEKVIRHKQKQLHARYLFKSKNKHIYFIQLLNSTNNLSN